MPIEFTERAAALSGVVTVEEVEHLATWLRGADRRRVNLRACTHLHTGAFQALLRFRPKVSVPPLDSFVAGQLLPLLNADEPARPHRSEP